MKQFTYFLLLLFALSFFSCKKDKCIRSTPAECALVDLSAQYEPVCGCDRKTYTNAGVAFCGGVISYQKGECN